MLEEIMNSIHNRFEVAGARFSGDFEISSGVLELPGLLPGQYFWIDGSVFNDGLHQYPATDLMDETFSGEISPVALPRAFEALCQEISDWEDKHPSSEISSESFGGYSYTKATGKDGKPLTWQDQFAARLNRWRKMA